MLVPARLRDRGNEGCELFGDRQVDIVRVLQLGLHHMNHLDASQC